MSNFSAPVDPTGSVSRSFASPTSPFDLTAPLHAPMNPAQVPLQSIVTSPSVAFSSLCIRTPHRAIPTALPPTPRLGASPRVSTFSTLATQDTSVIAPLISTPSASTKPLITLSTDQPQMLARTVAPQRRTNMGPPSLPHPLVTSTDSSDQQNEVLFQSVNNYMDIMGSVPSEVVDSHTDGFGTATPSSMDFVQEFAWVFDTNTTGNTSAPPSPFVQQPLNTFPATLTSPYPPMADDFLAQYASAGSSDPSPELPSPGQAYPCNPSPQVNAWNEVIVDGSLFVDEVQQPILPKPSPGLGINGPTISQESSSSSGVTQLSAVSAPKRPRLSLDQSTPSHRRFPSNSSGSSSPSPFIGPMSSTRPNGYRKNLKPDDLLAIDAPTQKRNYIFPSVTSRQPLPKSVIKGIKQAPSNTASPRKRSSSTAGLPGRDSAEQEEIAASSSEDHGQKENGEEGSDGEDKETLRQHVEEKRRANTIAARKSRRRKAEFIEKLKVELTDLQKQCQLLAEEKAQWQARAEQAEEQLKALEQLQAVSGFYHR
ncbi:hypothetical protein FRB99_007964 [Tulasnella sp. 403]|nr:hypothetical protein FRB99_007964 [Tulasnella sp. 403]